MKSLALANRHSQLRKKDLLRGSIVGPGKVKAGRSEPLLMMYSDPWPGSQTESELHIATRHRHCHHHHHSVASFSVTITSITTIIAVITAPLLSWSRCSSAFCHCDKFRVNILGRFISAHSFGGWAHGKAEYGRSTQ